MSKTDFGKQRANRKQVLEAPRDTAFAPEFFQGDVTVPSLLESFAEGVVITDKSGIILLVNTSAEQMFGYTKKELVGAPSTRFYPEEEQNAGKPEEELEKATEQGRVAYQGWRIRKDGSRFWADVIITALYDENGTLRGFSRDITEHKKVEEALRISGARYRSMFNNNPTMITTLAADLTMLSVNPFFASLLGYTVKELEGQSILKIVYEDDRPAVAEQLQRCLQNPEQVSRWRFRKIRKDGGGLWVEEIAQAVHDVNGGLNILVVCQDVTERKRMEEALRESENRFFTAFQATPSVLVISSLANGVYREVNEAFERVIGYRRDEVIGRSSLALNIWQNPEERAMVIRMLAEGKKIRDMEIGLRSKSGELIVGLYSAEIIEIGAEKCLLSLVNDITARKRMEEEIARLNIDLTTRATELEAANRELETFNYTVAHDLRKPLTVVNGYCQIIEGVCGDQLDEQCKGYLREIHDGTWRMNQLIDALLKFSSVAQVELNWEMVDLSSTAQAVAAELAQAEPIRRVDFRIAEGISVIGDASLLRVVLDNLLGNAWKYTGMQEEGVIEFASMDVEGKPTYFVRDNGAGFDMAVADKLFVPFQRLHGVETDGHGIGLSTVERIISRHGGRVWAEGEPGKGATFYFTLAAD